MEKKADIIPVLEGIVEQNTVSYRSDFQYDVQRLTAAMLEPGQEDRTFLWMSRPCGTWLFWEREVFLKDTGAHSTWTHPDYIAQADRIKAYRITVAPGRPGAFVLGKLQPLNYGEQVERVKRLALPVQQVTLDFEGCETRTMSYADYTSYFCELMCRANQGHPLPPRERGGAFRPALHGAAPPKAAIPPPEKAPCLVALPRQRRVRRCPSKYVIW